MTNDQLTALLAERIMGWGAGPERFLLGNRQWITRSQFQPFNRVQDAFRLLQKAASGFSLNKSQDGVLTATVKVGTQTGTASGEEERQAAHECAIRIRQLLSDRGWPEPVYADSGNGAHLLYYLPALELDRVKSLVEQCLKALDARFSDSVAKVDTATANASRICKLYGTIARKGDPTPERPHRLSHVLEEPETLTPVSPEALAALAAEAPVPTSSRSDQQHGASGKINSSAHRFDVQQWIDQHGLDVEGPEPWKGGRSWVLPTCPWNPEHRNKSAYIVQLPDGAVSAGCHHNGCSGKGWHALRDLLEPGWRSAAGGSTNFSSYVPAEWEPPIPFDRFNLPPFPTSVFPAWLRAFVEAEATATQTPADLASMLALSVLAAACAKKVRIEIKPGYQEPLNLFTVTALPPGNRKSAVFKHIVKPVEDYEREEAKRTAIEIAQKQAARKIKESKLKRLQEKAAGAKGLEFDSLSEQATSLAAELAVIPVSVPTRCVADDCTPEKLITLLGDQGGRIAVLSPEGDVFELMAGRYSANGKANLGVYLKGHAGDTLRVDRVGRAPEFINQPALTLGLTVQPEVIRGLAMNPGFRGRGLLGRFLYSLPASPLGYRDTNPPSVSEELYEIYREAVLVLLNLAIARGDDGELTPHILTLEMDARRRLRQFEAWVEPQLSEFGDLGRMTDWGGKVVGAVARITGLLHMADYAGAEAPWDIPICEATVERAIHVGMYLIEHAKAAFAEMGADAAVENAKAILRWIEYNRLSSFTRRDLHQAMRGSFKRAGEIDAPLGVLMERGFVRKRPDTPANGAGRPASPTVDVNPRWRSSIPAPALGGNFEDCEYFEKRSDEKAEESGNHT